MAASSKYCVGGGAAAWKWKGAGQDAKSWVAAFGGNYDASDPLNDIYTQVVEHNRPKLYGNNSEYHDGWGACCEASLRMRTILFCNSQPGDIVGGGGVSSFSLGAIGTTTKIDSLVGQTAQEAASIGKLVGAGSSAIVGAISTVAGIAGLAALPLSIATGISAHHAAAKEAQSLALTQMIPQVNAAIMQADQAFFAGKITADNAVKVIQQFATQFASAVKSLTKNCNAFCGYTAIINALAEISPQYYAAKQAAASGATVTASGTSTAPPISGTGAAVAVGAVVAAKVAGVF